MAALTLKILAGVLQMNSPDAAITSDNQGLKLVQLRFYEVPTDTPWE